MKKLIIVLKVIGSILLTLLKIISTLTGILSIILSLLITIPLIIICFGSLFGIFVGAWLITKENEFIKHCSKGIVAMWN